MNIDPQNLLRQYIKNYRERVTKRNSNVSQAAVAKKIGISSGALSEILNGKRTLSYKKAMIICHTLSCTDEQLEMIQSAFNSQVTLKSIQKAKITKLDETVVPSGLFELFADWRFQTICCLLRIKPHMSFEEIKKKTDIPVHSIQKLISSGMKTGFICCDNDKYMINQMVMRTGEDYPSDLLEKRHIESMETALQIAKASPDGIFNGTVTLRVDPNRLAEAKLMIEDSMKKICLYLSSGDATEVFDLHISLFPRTKINIKL